MTPREDAVVVEGGTERPWRPPVVIADVCLRCGASLDPRRDFDNHGPCVRDERPVEAAVDRLRRVEAAARNVLSYPGPVDVSEDAHATCDPEACYVSALRDALSEPVA